MNSKIAIALGLTVSLSANWAGAAFVAGSVLAAGWLLRWNARRWLIGGLALQGLFAAFFVVFFVAASTVDVVAPARRMPATPRATMLLNS